LPGRSTTVRSEIKSIFPERTVVLLARSCLIKQAEHAMQRRFAPGQVRFHPRRPVPDASRNSAAALLLLGGKS